MCLWPYITETHPFQEMTILSDCYQRVVRHLGTVRNVQPLQPPTVLGNCLQRMIRDRIQPSDVQRQEALASIY